MDDLVKYRLNNANEKLISAKLLLDNGQYKDSIGRFYYAIFTAVRAVLAKDRKDFSKHAGVIAYFQKEYLKFVFGLLLCLEDMMKEYRYITLMEKPMIKDLAAEWFHSKWGIPKEAYMECMNAYLNKETEYGWYLCLDGEKIVAGLGVIENDFHNRKDLAPNICAVYTEEEYRCKGIAGNLLNMAVADMKNKGITPIYLITNHTTFYEKYGWEFLCMVQGDDEPEMSRMYIHR